MKSTSDHDELILKQEKQEPKNLGPVHTKRPLLISMWKFGVT